MLAETTITTFIFLNFITWLLPPFFYRGLKRYYLLVVTFIFSGSYWIYIPLQMIYNTNLPPNILEERIPDALYYSFIAGIALNLSVFLFTKRKRVSIKPNTIISHDILQHIPKLTFLFLILRTISIFLLIYLFISAMSYIGVSGKVKFITDPPFWYSTLIPINTLLLSLLIIYDLKWSKKRLSTFAISTLILIFFHVFLVGFDGSRRDALLPIIAIGLITFSLSLDQSSINTRMIKKLIFFIIFFASLSALLSINRRYLVGWQMFSSYSFNLPDLLSDISFSFLSPMPTLHVNTQMADLIATNGTEGYISYFSAMGNTLAPHFIFKTYFFGEPLALVLQDRFGWYGQDFGFLAEAILAGGTTGVIIMHTIFGLIISKTLNGIRLNKLFYIALAIGLIFGMSNSLRSDFMNLLKSSLYSSLTIYFGLIYLSKKIKGSRG